MSNKIYKTAKKLFTKKYLIFYLMIGVLSIPSCLSVDFKTDISHQSSIAMTRVFAYTPEGLMRYQGTSFAVDKNRLLTAGHLCEIEEGELLQRVEIQSIKNGYLVPGDIRTATIVDIHPTVDVCMLHVTDHGLKPVSLLADLDNVDSGADIITEGCPRGMSYYRVNGWMLTKKLELLTCMMTIFPGQSGSPAWDVNSNKVIGMLVSYNTNFREISYAVSSEFLTKYIEELNKNGKTRECFNLFF